MNSVTVLFTIRENCVFIRQILPVLMPTLQIKEKKRNKRRTRRRKRKKKKKKKKKSLYAKVADTTVYSTSKVFLVNQYYHSLHRLYISPDRKMLVSKKSPDISTISKHAMVISWIKYHSNGITC